MPIQIPYEGVLELRGDVLRHLQREHPIPACAEVHLLAQIQLLAAPFGDLRSRRVSVEAATSETSIPQVPHVEAKATAKVPHGACPAVTEEGDQRLREGRIVHVVALSARSDPSAVAIDGEAAAAEAPKLHRRLGTASLAVQEQGQVAMGHRPCHAAVLWRADGRAEILFHLGDGEVVLDKRVIELGPEGTLQHLGLRTLKAATAATRGKARILAPRVQLRAAGIVGEDLVPARLVAHGAVLGVAAELAAEPADPAGGCGHGWHG
mmetsp:Transcript_1528/g.3478  ORF Transcript_1528/g.3478 Transcript_1528/m.3478 type:complete len:265 (-) Transcript_1528:174-968(-)